MKRATIKLLLVAVLSFALNGCQSDPLSELPSTSHEEAIEGNGSVESNSRIPYEGPDIKLQVGNSLPQFEIVTIPSNLGVADIRLGVGAYSNPIKPGQPNYLERSLKHIINFGTYRVDTLLGEHEEPINWENSWEDEIPEAFDQFIDGLNENGVAVNYMLHFWDKAGHENGEELSTPRFQSEEQIQEFLDYVRFVVSHYKGRVQYYTIWSESDACPGIKCIEAEDYINLVRLTVPVIHEEDPQAKVAIAPNVLFFAQDYLTTVLESDIMTMVDVVQWHGVYDVQPSDPFYGDYYYDYPGIIEEIKQTAAAHGFDGAYWASEITWCSQEFPHCHPSDQPWGMPKTDKQAAKYYARSIVMHLGMDIGVGTQPWLQEIPNWAPWTLPTTRNLYTVMAGTRPIVYSIDIEREPANTLTYSFALPIGDRLFALWTDGEAADDDPGESVTLTFLGVSAQQVMGIDVLYGFEQELITEMENTNLIINNLLVKDYPILIKISDTVP